MQLQKAQEYIAALSWFRAVYDYITLQKIYYGLVAEETGATGYARQQDWLLDPLDIHAIAATRQNAYTRFTFLAIIRCLLNYADAEFTRDTVESLPRARMLYETALELLQLPELKQDTDIIGYLETTLGVSRNQIGWRQILTDMSHVTSWATLRKTIDNVRQIIQNTPDEPSRFVEIRKVVDAASHRQRLLTIGSLFEQQRQAWCELPKRLLGGAEVEDAVQQALLRSGYTADAESGIMLQAKEALTVRGGGAGYAFAIPPNPLIKALRLHAENNLRKLRRGRNIAGIKRELELYAAPTDVLSALPTIGAGGQLTLPIRNAPSPLPYRYEFLIERAKQLVSLAAQMEAGLLAALEKRDVESYSLLKARQDARLARSGVRLQSLRVNQAKDEVRLAELQGESATKQRDAYTDWIEAGLNAYEEEMLNAYETGATARSKSAFYSAGIQVAQAFISAAAGGVTGGGAAAGAAAVSWMAKEQYHTNVVAIGSEALAQTAAIWASHERRKQEWELQRILADMAIQIAGQQQKIAEDGVAIIEQEKNIAQMQVDHAEQVVEFLNNKFTNVELYDWMSGVLEGVYSYFLQQATAMAKLAQSQLAFERQEAPAAFIQDDYWVAPSEGQMGGASETATDRHGLTGSARLLADLYKLDQYRVETEKRKLQLTKVISLAHLAPFEFEQFKESGVLTFGTPIELFDRDFPGHYLRLIKRVRTSVVALIPPAHGIKATLSTAGASWVVVKNDELFQRIARPRLPESVALTSPVNATGLFELESQPEMLLPFEGLGVDTLWEFRMPKAANQFDYSTIADILLTIEYTALDDWDYRQQVIQSLPTLSSGERPFSFRHQFADAWYDLNNPPQGAKAVTVRFRTERADFPPNLDSLQIEQVLLYFARKPGVTDEIPVTLTSKPAGGPVALGGAATSIDGVISTRRGNAGAWALLIGSTPVGEWELTLQDAAVNFCKEEKIEDLLFVITFAGRTPAWPA
ncbi:MAG: hypothetical protein DYG89_28920 [Caldilinea sp. CFX5]|nr:hypothetical protein [Caldilinea sp. CFX5]